MRHRVGVPAFGEHGHGHHTFDMFSQLARLAHRVHDFPQQVFIADFPARKAGAVFIFKFLNLSRGNLFKFRIHGVAGFKLFAVNQNRVGTPAPSAVPLIAENRQTPRHNPSGAVAEFFFPARDIVKYQFGNIGIIAYHNKNRRRERIGSAFRVLFPYLIVFHVIFIKTLQRALQNHREFGFAADCFFFSALFGQILTNPKPNIPIRGLFPRDRIIRHRNAWNFDNTAFNRINQ